MVIGERIATRLSELGISQAELARRVGVSQQAVGKLVKGDSRSSSYLHKIAQELLTTPAYLSGEIDDPDAGAPPNLGLDADQRELVDAFANLSSADKRALLQIVRTMSSRGRRLHEPKDVYRPKN